MNLAEAIRRAALARGESPVPSAPEFESPVPAYEAPIPAATLDKAVLPHAAFAEVEEATTLDVTEIVTRAAQTPDDDEPAIAMPTAHFEAQMPDPPAPIVGGGSVVRLELFLAPEQLSHLFKSIVATQHSVMTLREAASFLRVSPNVLEQMAEERSVPAFQIDGRWRFPRAGLDEWLSLRSAAQEAV